MFFNRNIQFRKFVLITLFGASICLNAQQNNTYKSPINIEERTDSTKTKTKLDSIKLGEVVVTADNTRFENGKVVMTPSKKAKNLAQNISSLIDIMNTGILVVKDGKVMTFSGEPVNIFINGTEVDMMDNATFWAKNVQKVEYLPITDEINFQGKSHVLNIIMKEYITGGLTRISGKQTIPNDGKYSIASKLVTGKVTFNALISGGYKHDRLSGDKKTENYNDVWYNGKEYDVISRTEESSNIQHNKNLFAGLNARYKGNKFIATHSFSYSWNREPKNTTIGAIEYSPEIIKGNRMQSINNSKSHSYSLTGTYTYPITKKNGISGNWDVKYINNRTGSTYSETGISNILTDVLENVWAGSLKLAYYHTFSQKLSTSMSFSEAITSFNTNYSGTTDSKQKQFNNSQNIELFLYYKPFEAFSFNLKPTLNIFTRDINNKQNKTDILPGLQLRALYTINMKSNLNLNVFYFLTQPAASMSNELILRQTELKWIEGQPSLKPSQYYSTSITYNYRPIKWFSFIINPGYAISRNESSLSYRSGGEKFDGVIGQYINGLNEHTYSLNLQATFKPCNGNLNIIPGIDIKRTCVTSINSVNEWRPKLDIAYFLDNWSFATTTSGPERYLSNGGTELCKTKWQYNFIVNYGNGNLSVGLDLSNIFTKHWNYNSYFSSGPYNYNSLNIRKGRYALLSLTYTFDYGKKVDRSINISSSNNATTSILGSK